MKCPRCVQNIHRAADICPHCDFSIEVADQQFGSNPSQLRKLTDLSGVFRHKDRLRIEEKLNHICQLCPQIYPAVYVKDLAEATLLRQFGFWLLNRGCFVDIHAPRCRDAGVLLTIDPDSKSAGIIFGYLLEPWFTEEDSFDCLAYAHSHWLEGRYGDGVIAIFSQLETILRKRCKSARKVTTKYRT